MGASAQNVRVVGRYALYGALAAGGMATVHLGRLLGPVGFSRTVAIKRLHAQFASDPEFVSMFLDEARLAARIRHPNVVPTLDVVATAGELFLVMEYVPGESIARLARALRARQQTIPLRILSGVMAGVLHGLHAAHEAKDERGHPLGIVHRDVSPQNVLVGTDGVARVLDFGVAKAAGRMQTTKEGQIKGKLSYMPPEQLRGASVTRQTDIYACGVMLWELVTGQRLFVAENEGAIVTKILGAEIERPSVALARARAAGGATVPGDSMGQIAALDETILRAVHMEAEARHATARELALEIERTCPPATASEIGDWVESVARDVLASRATLIAEIESSSSALAGGDGQRDVMTVLGGKETLGPGDARAPAAPFATAVTQTMEAGSRLAPLSAPARSSAGYAAHVDGPPVTQPSSISVSSSGTPFAPSRRGPRAILMVAAGVFVGGALLAGAFAYRHFGRSPSAAGAPSGEPAALGSREADAPDGRGASASLADAGAPSISAAPSASAASAASAAPDAAPATTHAPSRSPAPTTKRRAPERRASPSSKTDGDCNPAFWFDEQGVKHYKPQCLGGTK